MRRHCTVDLAEINKLVADRDKGAFKFLNLENATDTVEFLEPDEN